MMIGEGANKLAKENGLERISQEKLVTDEAKKELNEWLRERQFGETFGHETVGAVAMDSEGNLAAATSTGGVTGKRVGRVGDVPIIGSGGYADNRVGAVSTTGHGESIMKVTLARLVLSFVASGEDIQLAAEKALRYMSMRVNGNGGLIAIDSDGNIAHAFTTSRMAWAFIKEDEKQSGINPLNK
jgi:beta-aspartyl-peptidase (threonine type)